MQYGPSLGFMGLRQAIADRMNRMYCPMGMDKVDPKNIMITTGSQQGLDITGRVFIDKDDVVLIESPSYLALSVHSLSNSRNSSKFRPMIRHDPGRTGQDSRNNRQSQIHLRHPELPEPDRYLLVPGTPPEIYGSRYQV